MAGYDIISALEEIWPELPALAGAAWPWLEPRLRALVAEYKAASDDEGRARASARIQLLLEAQAPGALAPLDEMVAARDDNWLAKGIHALGLERLARRGAAPPAGVPITRYTDITAPRRLALGQRGVITVGLTRAPAPDSRQVDELSLLAGPVEVHLQAFPADFEILGTSVRSLVVEPDRDSEPVVFYIRGAGAGAKKLWLDFRQGGVLIGTARVTIQVVADAAAETDGTESVQSLAAPLAMGRPSGPAHDLDLRVIVRPHEGGIDLLYTLHSPNGACHHHYQEFPVRHIPGYASPQAYQAQLVETLEALGKGHDASNYPLAPEEAADRLNGLGRHLYEELFPTELKDAYRRFRGTARTLQITSDEPWIPWELIRPYDDRDPRNIIDDDFLCMRFQVTRWLAGAASAAGQIAVRRLVCVEAGQAPGHGTLQHTREERERLAALAAAHGIDDRSPEPATRPAVLRLLDEGGTGLWHVAGHGHLDPSRPDEALILLADGNVLRVRQTSTARGRH